MNTSNMTPILHHTVNFLINYFEKFFFIHFNKIIIIVIIIIIIIIIITIIVLCAPRI
jgi:hypothetical protein